jgi:hypothetical protein
VARDAANEHFVHSGFEHDGNGGAAHGMGADVIGKFKFAFGFGVFLSHNNFAFALSDFI